MDKGKVIAHENYIDLEDCNFLVNESGRRRVVESGRKNVHAFVTGKHGAPTNFKDRMNWVRVRYNPYAMDQFIRTDNQQPVYTASRVYMDGLGNVFADKPT